MAHIFEDRVLESTTTTGTVALALAGAVTGFRRFSAVCGVGDTVPYFIEAIDSLGQPTGDYEYGIGTYSAANTLTRTTVLGSSNGGIAVNFAAGSKNVGLTLLSSQFAPRASPALTGTPTAPTQANADDSTKLATTGWVRAAMASVASVAGFAVVLAATGYIKLPSWLGGLIIQWGNVAIGDVASSTPVAVAFPLAFPTLCVNVQLTATETAAGQWLPLLVTKSTTGFNYAAQELNPVVQNAGISWLAVGY